MSTNQTTNEAVATQPEGSGATEEQLSKIARREFALEVGQRCRAARGTMAVAYVAETLGVHRNTIANIERGESVPSAFELVQLARLFDVSPSQLLSGAGGESEAHAVLHRTVAVELDGFVYVPHFDVRASAGPGDPFVDVERVKAMRPFDASYIRNELGIAHNELALIDITGNSMEPKLRSRDVAMIDRRSVEVHTEGIHVIRLDGALLVKRVQRLPGRVLRITSDNQTYAPFDIQGVDDAERDFSVIGQACWAGVTLK